MLFLHGSTFSDSRNVQKCVTQIIYLRPRAKDHWQASLRLRLGLPASGWPVQLSHRQCQPQQEVQGKFKLLSLAYCDSCSGWLA